MIPRTIFTEEHLQFRDSVRKFLQEEALPHHDQWELEGQVSRELWQKAGAQGLLAPSVTEEYGGVGVDYLYNTIISEEIARMGLSGIGFGLHSDIAVPYIEHHGT